MKGLLLKDWYMMRKYCRSYLFIAVGFLILSFMDKSNMFFVFYPCLFCGMVPVNLLAYDERSRWLTYSGTLPYTRAQIVSGKYLIGLFTQTAMLLLTGIAQGIRLGMDGGYRATDVLVILLLLLIASTVTSSVTLPFMFKLGVERGRAAYYVMIGLICGISALLTGLFREPLRMEIRPNLILVLLAAAGVGIYALSWYLAIVFYRKREL
ncbi:MAG: ABC-2 transporter permease [Clostridia bacterium]|nr:ABC-2 transporter permease [Clostridia bacterium]